VLTHGAPGGEPAAESSCRRLRDWRAVRREEVSEGVVQVCEMLPFPMPPAPKMSLTFGTFQLPLN
jgi:hypothetical protein